MTSSIPYLKEYCTGFVINNKSEGWLLMQHGGTLENPPFRVTLYINAKAPIEQLLHKNHKHGSRSKDLKKIKYASKNTGLPQAKIARPCPKVKSVWFDDPYDHIHHMELLSPPPPHDLTFVSQSQSYQWQKITVWPLSVTFNQKFQPKNVFN